ncbi:MAG: zinc ribbon domain-containing protein [Candidatus Kariarchaeaceae archaeon]
MADFIVTRKSRLEKLDLPVSFPNDFRKIVNTLINKALKLDYSTFDDDSLQAVKTFIKALNDNYPKLKENLQPEDYTIKERIFRCGAQLVYFAVRGYRLNQGHLLDILSVILKNNWFADKGTMFKEIMKITNLNYYEIDNKTRFIKNHLVKQMKEDFEIIKFDNTHAFFLDLVEKKEHQKMRLKLLKDKDFDKKMKKSFIRRAVIQMNRRFHELRKKDYAETTNFDETILSILDLKSIDQVKKVANKIWQKKKITWKQQIKAVNLQLLPPQWDNLEYDSLTVLKNMLEEKEQRIFINGATTDEFVNFVQRFFKDELFKELLTYMRKSYTGHITQLLKELEVDLNTKIPVYLKIPEFKGSSIPLGLGEKVVYSLTEIRTKDLDNYLNDPKLCSWKVRKALKKFDMGKIAGKILRPDQIIAVQVRFSVSPQVFHYTFLKDVERYDKMIKLSFTPKRGVLDFSKEILAIPFQKKADGKKGQGVIASADLGLKTFSTISIFDTTQNEEIDRFFLDQKDLGSKKDEWFDRNLQHKPVFLKGKLLDHRFVARKMQSIRSTSPRNSMERWRARTTEKIKWTKVSNTHRELVRQISTRMIALLLHYNVGTLVLENLKWSRNSPKSKVGYFLAHWQVHWFFAQVQKRLEEQCLQHGIRVEKVNPAYSSKTCSKCGLKGKRNGKHFTCECGFSLDSDLNAARNLIIRSKIFKKLAKKLIIAVP